MLFACLDVGSTFTKGLMVGSDGLIVASADHRTTVDSDVLVGVDAVLESLTMQAGSSADDVRLSSSAGGGLRLAVVGHERAISAQAGLRVGLSSGARVVHVGAGLADADAVRELEASRPDIVLLVGGTDGGDTEVIVHNARMMARRGPRVPYVVAGNAAVREEVMATLLKGRRQAIAADNVIPRIGVLDPGSARAAIRELFLTHVIGGKRLSRGRRFASMVQGATPDIVLRAVELLADGIDGDDGDGGVGDVVVVDVGGATTDVYSVVSPDPASEHAETEDVAGLWRAARTVEGDLGMRWSAPGVVDAAVAERLVLPADETMLRAQAAARHDDVGLVPAEGAAGADDRAVDSWLARSAVTVAVRRHARPADIPGGGRTAARDLRRVGLIVGSGGVLRHSAPEAAAAILAPLTTDLEGGWLLPTAGARTVIDRRSALAAAGLLAPDHPAIAHALLTGEMLA